MSVEFDILDDLLQHFELQMVFKFIHTLNARLDSVNALAHYYLDPTSQPDSTVNVFSKLFDLTIMASETTFFSGA